MRQLQSFSFFKSQTEDAMSNPLSCIGASELTIQVSISGSTTIKVGGIVDVVNGSYTPLAVLDLSTMEFKETIDGEGIYTVACDGLHSIVLSAEDVSGEVTAFGTLVE